MKSKNLIMGLLCLAIFMVTPLLVLFNFSWAQCPEAPNDLGICDTLYVEPWAHTDTCFDYGTGVICINQPGEEFPCFLYVSLFVTHDSNTFWWLNVGTYVQDSIAAFVTPFIFWHNSETGKVTFPTWNHLNNTKMEPTHAWFSRSMFRHIVDEDGDSIYNRFALMHAEGWADWTPNLDLDTLSGVGDSGHMFMSLIPVAGDCRRWWQGSRVLLATFTFILSDSVQTFLDSTLWPPSSRLEFTRYDAKNYVPRHPLPLTMWVGPPWIEVTTPNGGETWSVGSTKDITWLSANFTGDVKIEYSTNGGNSWILITPITENDGIFSWTVENTPSTNCLMKISDASDGDPYDESDNNFTIVQSGEFFGEATADSQLIGIGTGGAPRWSPDGTRLGFISGGWLCVANADGEGEVQKIAQLQFNSLDWMSDSAFVVSENIPWTPEGKGRGHKLAIRTVDMKGQIQTIREDSIIVIPQSEYLTYPSVPVILQDGTVGYYEIYEKPEGETKIFKIIKQGKLKHDLALKQMIATTEGYPTWGEIWLESADLTVRKKITPSKKYLFPKLSPDGTKILASYGPAEFVLDLKGNVLLDLGKERPQPPAGRYAYIGGGSWSPDTEKILYYVTVEDGHSVYDKDIYVININGTGKIPIAVTPEEQEGGASWSPDGTKIAYLNGTTGKIYVVKIK